MPWKFHQPLQRIVSQQEQDSVLTTAVLPPATHWNPPLVHRETIYWERHYPRRWVARRMVTLPHYPSEQAAPRHSAFSRYSS